MSVMCSNYLLSFKASKSGKLCLSVAEAPTDLIYRRPPGENSISFILSNTVILYYLALSTFYVGVFSEINLISVKLIILNDFFCDIKKVSSLI